jgi:hypothetical protein
MTAPGDKFDPEVLQARWVLGGIWPGDLPDQAILALEHGFDGTALQQLAGLVRPTVADLGNLPERAFADMGLKPMDKDAAVNLLIARGIPPTNATISLLLEALPDFGARWREHIAHWGGNSAGSYNDMAEFVHFVMEDLYEQGKRDEVRRVFELVEKLLLEADEDTTNLIGLGFLETLQNIASWRPYGNKAFEEFLGERSMQIWRELQRIWAGKSSLADVIRAERDR